MAPAKRPKTKRLNSQVVCLEFDLHSLHLHWHRDSLTRFAPTVRNEVSGLVLEDCGSFSVGWSFHGDVYGENRLLYDKVIVLESEKRAWESSPEAQGIREALNPWRNNDAAARKKS